MSDINLVTRFNRWIHLLPQLHQHLWRNLITFHLISIMPRKQTTCNGCNLVFPTTERWKAHLKTSPQCKDKHFPCNHCRTGFCGYNIFALEKHFHSSKSCKRKHESFVDGTIGKLPPGTEVATQSTHQKKGSNNYLFEALVPMGQWRTFVLNLKIPQKKECLVLEQCHFHHLIWLMDQTL